MSERIVCDICGQREASRRFKVKVSRKGMYVNCIWEPGFWRPYKKIDICGECGEKLLNLPYLDHNGFSKIPAYTKPKR